MRKVRWSDFFYENWAHSGSSEQYGMLTQMLIDGVYEIYSCLERITYTIEHGKNVYTDA